MTMGVFYTTPAKFNFARSYISGFVASAGDSNLSIAGDEVTFDYLYPVYQVKVVFKHVFMIPNSNFYTLDWIIDTAASQVYQSGTPIAAAIGVGWRRMLTEPTWRIQLHSNFTVVEALTVDLPALPGYWRPLWP